MNKENIFPRNEKGELHGYCEQYYPDGSYYKGNFINDIKVGYWEYYDMSGDIMHKNYYIR